MWFVRIYLLEAAQQTADELIEKLWCRDRRGWNGSFELWSRDRFGCGYHQT